MIAAADINGKAAVPAGAPASSGIDAGDWKSAIVLGVVGFAALLPALFWGNPGGKAINNALRILHGDVVYRDFWTMYAPGHFYLVAALFKLFGTHVWVQGIASQLILAVDAAILFVIMRRLGLARQAAFLFGAVFVFAHWGQKEITSYETALLFLLLALDRAVCYARGQGAQTLVLAGLFCGVGAWFKHDVSFYVAFGIAAGFSASWFLVRGRRPDGWRPPMAVLARVAGGALAAALPVIALIAWKAGPDAWRDVIIFPATDFRVVRGENYPALLPSWGVIAAWAANPANVEQVAQVARHLSIWVEANAPQLVFASTGLLLIRRRHSLSSPAVAVAAVAIFTLPLFWAAAHVQQNTHLFSMWIYSTLAGTIFWIEFWGRRPVRLVLLGLFAIYAGAFLVNTAQALAEIAYLWPGHATLEFPAVKGIRVPRVRYEVLQPIVSFIRANVPESEPIYSGLVRHDSIVISNPNFYFLSGRLPASRYNEIHPGVVDREEVQQEIIADLNRLNVRCAVLWDFGWSRTYMDEILALRRQRIPELGATTLDEFFRREFQQIGRYGEYVLVWRKGGSIPPAPDLPPTSGQRPNHP